MDFGSTIKAAREAHGLTTSQVAAQTRILVQIIEGMEKNEFKKIPAPIYGRGFVKLICECLDLDPVIMIPAFMSAYNGEPQIADEPRQASTGGIRYAEPLEPEPPPIPKPAANEPPPQAQTEAVEETAVAKEPQPVQQETHQPQPQPVPEPAAAQPQQMPEPPVQPPQAKAVPEAPPKAAVDTSLKGLELFDQSSIAPEPPSQPIPQAEQPAAPARQPQADNGFSRFAPPAQDRGFSRFAPPTAQDDFSRFAAPLPEDDTPTISPLDRFREGLSAVSSGVLGKMKEVRRPAFRITLLAVCLVIVLALCGWGIVALFRATSGKDDKLPNTESTTEVSQTETEAPADQAKSGEPEAKPEEKAAENETAPASDEPVRPTVPLSLPGFYVD